MRTLALRITENERFKQFIIFLLIANAIILGVETTPGINQSLLAVLHTIDHVILAIFVTEITLRIIALRLQFFKNGWNLFDFVIVGISILPFSESFAILRSLRILRLLRLFSVVPRFRTIVNAVISAIPGIMSIVLILMIFYYVFSVMVTSMFAADFPEWFGSLSKSMFTLFQIMTLEDWAGIVREVMKTHPYAWMIFISFILVTTFTMLNLFIAVMITAMQNDEIRKRANDPDHIDVKKLRKGS